MRQKIRYPPCWLLLLWWTGWILCVAYADDQVYYYASSEPNDAEALEEEDGLWSDALSTLGPSVAGLCAVLLLAHLLLFPDAALRHLMHQYLTDGIKTIGTVLSCRERGDHHPRGESLASSGQLSSSASNPQPQPQQQQQQQHFLVEIMYEACEHKHADNPHLKFRNPNAWERKRFMRTFVFHRTLARGDEVEVLVLPGPNHTRSGCPTEVVQRILTDAGASTQRQKYIVLGLTIVALSVGLGLAVQNIRRLDDAAAGWIVLLGGVTMGEVVSLLVCADRFFKSKRRRFNSAQPMVSSLEQQHEQLKQQQEERQHPYASSGRRAWDDPFRIPLHEFAGHARASERERF